jgi:hypothetical protein
MPPQQGKGTEPASRHRSRSLSYSPMHRASPPQPNNHHNHTNGRPKPAEKKPRSPSPPPKVTQPAKNLNGIENSKRSPPKRSLSKSRSRSRSRKSRSVEKRWTLNVIPLLYFFCIFISSVLRHYQQHKFSNVFICRLREWYNFSNSESSCILYCA